MRYIQGQDHVAKQMALAWKKPRPLVRLLVAGLILLAIAFIVGAVPTLVFGYFYFVKTGVDTEWLTSILAVTWVIGLIALIVGLPLYAISLSLMGEYSSRMTLKRLIHIIQGEEYNRLKAGHDGEQAVKQTLSSLSNEWTLFSGVVLPGMYGDIDHVLVGPSGVFAIECKHYSGSITYDDDSGVWLRTNQRHPDGESLKDPAEQLLATTRQLNQVIGRSAVPLVVFTNDRAAFVGEHPQVTVLLLHRLLQWIQMQPKSLLRNDIDQIIGVLTQVSTVTAQI